MNGEPDDFWGKLNRKDREVTWHPLADHCADVAACFEALLRQPVIRKRLARLGGLDDLSEIQCARLSYLAALHDLGKYNLGFQNNAYPKKNPRAGHVREPLALFGSGDASEERLSEAIRFPELCSWGADEETIGQLLVTALAHHGKPEQLGLPARSDIWQATGAVDPFRGIADLAVRARRWFRKAFEECEPAALPAEPAFQHAFNGLLTLADWIGSDTNVFPFSNQDDGNRFASSQQRARLALSRIGIDTGAARACLGLSRPGFNAVSQYSPREAQRRLTNLPIDEQGSLTILEAETGSGKTEAALARFIALFHAGAVDGLYFALPTRTAATQIFDRVHKAVVRAFPDEESRPPVTRAVPGYIAADDRTARRLPDFKVLWNDEDKERWRYRGWAAERPKRYLAGAVVVGTIDQVLLSALAVSHAHLRASSLLRHLLVVDEVHASDVYMTQILEAVLERQLAAGGHALLMSATLGSTARTRFLGGKLSDLPSLETACEAPYPVVTHQPVKESARQTPVHDVGAPKTVRVELSPNMGSPDKVAEMARDAARQGARVIVIRNTVRDCIATQQALEDLVGSGVDAELVFRCGDVRAPHHSRFAREDRMALDRALEFHFRKGADSRPCIVVATQTVQQSLDIDADYMITDLCPADVWLQRLGRLHRHRERGRPAGYEEPTVIVLVPPDRDLTPSIKRQGSSSGPHGLGTVYEDLRIVEATWRLLETAQTVEIPAMNRRLVEEATHPEALRAITDELGDEWRQHDQHRWGVTRAEQRLAALNLADWSVPYCECLFPTGEMCRAIKTRLGEGDRLVKFQPAVPGPFDKLVEELSLPGHMVHEADPDDDPRDVEVVPGGMTFGFGSGRYRYDRLGLRKLEKARPSEESIDA